jgi:hypothetical protein
MMGLTWFKAGPTDVKLLGEPAPAWALRAARDDDGTVFVPAAMADFDEARVMLAASRAGEPMIQRDKHLYVRADWLAAEYPAVADAAALVKMRLDECRGRDEGGGHPA